MSAYKVHSTHDASACSVRTRTHNVRAPCVVGTSFWSVRAPNVKGCAQSTQHADDSEPVAIYFIENYYFSMPKSSKGRDVKGKKGKGKKKGR